MSDKINIVISRSQQGNNACIMGDTEQDHMGLIVDALESILKQDNRLNVYNIPKLYGTDTENLYKLVDLSNEFIKKNGGQGFHAALHSDGGYDGTGASGLYVSEAGKTFGRPIYDELVELTPWSDMSFSKRTNLYELNNTLAIAFLLELSFHDQRAQAEWIHNNVSLIAQTIAKGIYKGIGLDMPIICAAENPPYVRDLIPQGIQMQYFEDHLEVRIGNGPWKVILFD